MTQSLAVLIVEDVESDAQLIVRLLTKAGYKITFERVETGAQMRAALEKQAWEIVISDYSLPEFDGHAALMLLLETGPDIPFIVVSGTMGEETAVDMMKAGAHDYVMKGNLARLVPAVERELIQAEVRRGRKRADEALRESESKFRGIVEQSSDGIVLADEQGIIIEWNKSQEQITDIRRGDALGKPIWDILYQTLSEELKTAITYERFRTNSQSLLRAGEAPWLNQLQESVIQHSDGTRRGVQAMMFPIRTINGLMVASIVRDITERKLAEEALRESEERYRMLLETLPDGVIVHSQGRVVFANPASATIIGAASLADINGKPVIEFVHPDYRELALKRIQQSLSEGIPVPLAEEKFVRLDGTLIDVEVSATPISYAGKPAMLTVFNEITERKRAEEALTREQYLLRTLLDNLPDHIYFKDRDSRFTRVSKSQAEIFGFSDSTEVLGKTDFDFFTEAHARPAFEAEQNMMTTGQPVVGLEEKETWPDGQLTWINTTKMPLRDQAGNIIGTFGISSDITKRKQAEERIQRQLEHLTALSAIDRTIATNINMELSLTTLLVHVIAQLHVDAAAVLLFEPGSLKLEYASTQGFRTKGIDHLQLPLLDGYSGHVVLDRQTVKIPNIKDLKEKVWLTAFLADDDFVCYYGVPLIAKGQVKGVLEVFQRSALEPDTEWLDFLNTLAGQTAIAIENATLFESLQRSNLELTLAYDDTIVGWSRALDLRDKETEGHTQRVTEMAMKLARHSFDQSESELVQVRWGALLHDIGKMGVPDEILLKPGPLTDEEWVKMKMHPTFAYELLAPIRFLQLALDIPYCHHEKWDGTGYPRGLKGAQIPLVARLFAVVDVWDALSSDRPYRPGWPEEKVRQHILSSAGTHFDPQVVGVFMQLLNKN